METFYNVLLAFIENPAFTAGFFVYGYIVALFAKRLIQIDKIRLSLEPVTRGDYVVAVVLVAHMLHWMLMAAALVFTLGIFLFVLAGFMVVAPVIVLGHALAAFPIPNKYQGMKVQGGMVLFTIALIGFVLWQVSFSAPAAVGTTEDRQDAMVWEAIREGNINFAQTIQNAEDRNQFYYQYSYSNNQPEVCGRIDDRWFRRGCYSKHPEFEKTQYVLCLDYPGLSESDQYYFKSVCRYEQGVFEAYLTAQLRGERFSCNEFQLWFQQSWYQQNQKSPDIGEDQNLLCQNLETVYSLTQAGDDTYCDKFGEDIKGKQFCLGLFVDSEARLDACLETDHVTSRIRLQCDEDLPLEDLIFYREKLTEFLTEDFSK